MTFAAEQWPLAIDVALAPPRRARASVWRLELTKLAGQWRVRAVATICMLTPLVAAAYLTSQQSTPSDTLFAQWLHASGWAIPMALLSWAGQWGLPAVTALVAGDIFSSEDHLGTWRTVLTRSRSRGQLFWGKVLAACTYAVVMLALLVGAALLAGVLSGNRPLVGLTGQTVPAGRAAALVALSWACELPPLLAFTGLALVASVVSRRSVVGVGLPVLASLVLQVLSLAAMPVGVRRWLPTTPFGSWTGLWAVPSFAAPAWWGVITSATWLAVCLAVAWGVFRRRDVGTA